ncbi:MAG: peptidylprolyl isomerase, partial [Thermocrispum sp.]
MTSKLDELEEVDVAETEVPGVGRTRRIIPASGRGRAILVVILIVLLGGGVGGFLWYQQNTLPDDAAFRVGDEVVTIDQLNGKVDTLRALYGVQVPR